MMKNTKQPQLHELSESFQRGQIDQTIMALHFAVLAKVRSMEATMTDSEVAALTAGRTNAVIQHLVLNIMSAKQKTRFLKSLENAVLAVKTITV